MFLIPHELKSHFLHCADTLHGSAVNRTDRKGRVPPPVSEDIPPLPDAVAMLKAALLGARAVKEHLHTVLNKGDWPV